MCVLYKKATKQFVQYDKSTTRSELVTDVSLASDLTREEARKLLHKCTKKLKDFKISERSQFPCSIQKAETVSAAVIKNAAKEAASVPNEEKEEVKEISSEETDISNQSDTDMKLHKMFFLEFFQNQRLFVIKNIKKKRFRSSFLNFQNLFR